MTSAVPYAEVIGDPIAHSKSPLIHRFWLRKLGINGDYRAVRVGREGLHRYLQEARSDPLWRGCNVTMPLKEAALPFAQELSSDCEFVSATNCLVPTNDGALQALNFDVEGVAAPLRTVAKADYPNHVATYVYLIGSGGAAKAAGLGAIRAGYGDFEIFTRNRAKGLELAALVGTPFSECEPLQALGPIRNPGDGAEDQRYSIVIINATPLGMLGRDALPIDLASFYPDTVVFDMVYDPLETNLLREARKLGMRTIDGLTMLVEQAAASFAAFFGQPAPRQHDAELRGLLTA